MAFNWSVFRTRSLTALVFVAVMLVGLLWNQWSFLVLFSLIHFGCWWEYFNLLEKIHRVTYHHYTRIGLMLLGYAFFLFCCAPELYSVNTYSLKNNLSFPVSLAGFVLLATGIFQKEKITLRSFGAAALGLVYISLSWGLMLNLYSSNRWHVLNIHDTKVIPGAIFIPLVIIAGIWINDTMAYISGSLIGKTPLSKISPKKTWEGTIGGALLCIVVIFFFWNSAYFSLTGMEVPFSVTPLNILCGIIAGIAAITGTLGDLFESKLKRMAGVKDSGSFMPGHGGFLDRFDSLLWAVPFVWLFIRVFV